MSASLLITELHDNPPHKEKEATTQSFYLVKNEASFKKMTSEVLDYMVNEETHYTDLLKIEDYFKEQSIKDYHVFNERRDEILKKQSYLDQLELQAEEVIILFLNYLGNYTSY